MSDGLRVAGDIFVLLGCVLSGLLGVMRHPNGASYAKRAGLFGILLGVILIFGSLNVDPTSVRLVYSGILFYGLYYSARLVRWLFETALRTPPTATCSSCGQTVHEIHNRTCPHCQLPGNWCQTCGYTLHAKQTQCPECGAARIET